MRSQGKVSHIDGKKVFLLMRSNILHQNYLMSLKERSKRLNGEPRIDDYDSDMLKYIYFGKHTDKAEKQSQSFNEGYGDERPKPSSYPYDEMKMLEDLSMMTAGARYELLNANKMLMDIDVSIKV